MLWVFHLRVPIGEVHLTKAPLGFADHHQIAGAFTFIAGVPGLAGSGVRTSAINCFGLSSKHNRAQRIVSFFIKVQHVFHRRDKLSTHCGNAPLLLLPRFECVFLLVPSGKS
jgi:hypothetical protein